MQASTAAISLETVAGQATLTVPGKWVQLKHFKQPPRIMAAGLMSSNKLGKWDISPHCRWWYTDRPVGFLGLGQVVKYYISLALRDVYTTTIHDVSLGDQNSMKIHKHQFQCWVWDSLHL